MKLSIVPHNCLLHLAPPENPITILHYINNTTLSFLGLIILRHSLQLPEFRTTLPAKSFVFKLGIYLFDCHIVFPLEILLPSILIKLAIIDFQSIQSS